MLSLKIVRKTKMDEKTTVHDIAVQDAHHYILDNGIVSHNSYVPTQELSGGSGLKYSSDSILTIRKSKDKDGTEVVGVIVKGRMYKSRMSRENQEAAMRISYDRGLDRHYGLLEFGEEEGIIERVGNKYVFPTIPDKKFFKKEILEQPERFWTREMLDLLEPAINRKFQYGVKEDMPEEEDDGVAEVPHDPETGEVLG